MRLAKVCHPPCVAADRSGDDRSPVCSATSLRQPLLGRRGVEIDTFSTSAASLMPTILSIQRIAQNSRRLHKTTVLAPSHHHLTLHPALPAEHPQIACDLLRRSGRLLR